MIECTDKKIWYTNKRKKRKKSITLFCFFVILIAIFTYYKVVVVPQIYQICLDKSKVYCVETINNAVSITFDDSSVYEDLVFVERNNDGDIVLMSANAYKVNTLSRTIEKIAYERLKVKFDSGIDVPILAFSGIDMIAGYGKNISFNALTISSVTCDFNSTFKSVGINQTLHSIYVDIKGDVKLEIPFSNYKNELKSSVLVCETVLVGKVPELYLNGKLFS